MDKNKRKRENYYTTSIVLDKELYNDFMNMKEYMNFKTISAYIRYLIVTDLAKQNKMTNKAKQDIIQKLLQLI